MPSMGKCNNNRKKWLQPLSQNTVLEAECWKSRLTCHSITKRSQGRDTKGSWIVVKYIFSLFSIYLLSSIHLVWLNQFFSVGPMNTLDWIILVVVLSTLECFAAFLASTHQRPVAHLPPHVSHNNQKCLQTLPNVPWEVGGWQNHPQLRTTGLNSKGASYGNDSDSLTSATKFFPGNRSLTVGISLPAPDFKSHSLS